jgi:hypothetical protein
MTDISGIPEATLLIMTPIGVPLYSARGLTQTLTPCSDAKPTPRRTINGEMRFVGANQMRKYDSVITCTDQNAPPFSGLWPGDLVTVQCVAELSYKTDTGSPERTVVSSRVVGGYTLYRPEIEFMVVDYNDSFQEYQAEHGWQLTLTER